MKALYVLIIVGVVLPLRLWLRRRRQHNRAGPETGGDRTTAGGKLSRRALPPSASRSLSRAASALEASLGDVGKIAAREIKERVRGRIFRVGTLIILVVVGVAIVVPTLNSGNGATKQTVGVVGPLPAGAKQAMHLAAAAAQDVVKLVPETSLAAAKAGLRSGKLDLAMVGTQRVLLNQPTGSRNSPADAGFVRYLAEYLGVLRAYEVARLTPAQAAAVGQAKPVPVQALQPGSKGAVRTTSVIGLVLLFFMLTQYCTWIMIGVMQEKSSRVVEVLLATVRAVQLLGGKVLGIGLVALGQATVVVGFALVVAKAVGSDLLKGTAPTVLLCELLWLVLGYAFYCWVYAAAGSTAERQDQIQTLALPLSIPILLAYIFSITVAASGQPDVLFKVLAYLPPTAPFCMSVLVSLSQVAWWQFVASVLISVASTAGMAVFAARVYRRAVLQTGGRVRLAQLFSR